ncbi:MAG: undecaprenyl/decaprenyl-phosphate alpha-N-acetylglucosaminyl 1-phosphate transferase [Spirochaetaceae bacterium]|nr:undecaprenyl/decaprenyl-phosphate alpha-N-acetylglucosaminyl 1-phosphate transferase [Spirochaetaceae bacterium]
MPFTPVLISSLLSGLTMPFIILFARKMSLYDDNSARKIHNGKIPRLGGMGIFWTAVLVIAFLPYLTEPELASALHTRLPRLVPLMLGAAIMHIIGLVDDLKGGLHVVLKLIFQCLAALIVVLGGYWFKGFGFHADILSGPLSWFSIIVSVGWIVGMSNAFNLIDGMDGLAGGISFIVSMAYGAFYLLNGDNPNAFICLALAGSIVGFLFFNFPAPKAKLFMGDSGSLFIGFSLAIMPFLGQTSGEVRQSQIGLLPAIVLLAIPMIDTLCAIGRRLKAGVGVTTADRLHIHHRFLDHGYSPIQILFIVYLLTIMQSVVFILARYLPDSLAFLTEIACLLVVSIFFRYGFSLKPKMK